MKSFAYFQLQNGVTTANTGGMEACALKLPGSSGRYCATTKG